MKAQFCMVLLATVAATGQASSTSKPKSGPQTPTPPATATQKKQEGTSAAKPQRVHAHLEGFELDKTAANKEQTQIGGATRGAMGLTSRLLAPNKGKAFSTNPTFYWTAAGSVSKYRFRLENSGGAVVYENEVSGTSFAYPTDAPKLEEGNTYRWTVQPRAMLSRPARPVEIVIVSGEERQSLAKRLDGTAAMSTEAARQRTQAFIDSRIWYDALATVSAGIDRDPENADLYLQRAMLYDQLAQTKELADADSEKAEALRLVHRP